MAEPSILGALRDPQFRSDTLRNLVDALNGAKRSLTVGSLGAVGDMGSTLANLVRAGAGTAYHEATGRPIPQALEYRDPARDFGTSASLGNFAESQGWLPPQTYSMPEQAGALLGPIVGMKAPDLAQSTLRGLVSALKSEPSRRMVEGYMGGMGMKPQAIVWHGSPHSFDAFDSSKIGTGEGAQAYGHGLYLAEAPDVATTYKNALSRYDDLPTNGPVQAAGAMIDAKIPDERMFSTLRQMYGNDPSVDIMSIVEQARAAVAKGKGGALYKVDLPDPLIARMLDWDKPLSQQNMPMDIFGLAQRDGIRKMPSAFGSSSVPPSVARGIVSSKSGQQAYQTLVDAYGAENASLVLKRSGIPGIRYLDGGSRADGAGTSNFVVFPGEESALTILERNGMPVRR